MLTALADAVLENPGLLDRLCSRLGIGSTLAQRKRVVADQVASLTDQSATSG
jgi:dGTP triphosphohydrolase